MRGDVLAVQPLNFGGLVVSICSSACWDCEVAA
jgi:hypothetical protein